MPKNKKIEKKSGSTKKVASPKKKKIKKAPPKKEIEEKIEKEIEELPAIEEKTSLEEEKFVPSADAPDKEETPSFEKKEIIEIEEDDTKEEEEVEVESSDETPTEVGEEIEVEEIPVKKEKKKKKKMDISIDVEEGSEEDDEILEKEDIDKKLVEIYENDDGSMPDMTHFQGKKKGQFIKSFITLLFACAFLVAVAWAGFFIIQPKSYFSEKGVVLSISGDESVSVGDEVKYRIRYKNSQNSPLTKAVLQIRYPEGFVFVDSSVPPSNEAKDEWTIGDLGGHDSGYIDISGVMYGNVGKKQSFRIFLNYMAENFSSEFQKVASTNIEVAESPFSLLVEGEDEIVVGADLELAISLEGLEDVNTDNMAIEIAEGAFFSIKESDIDPDQFIDNRWNVSDLGEEKKLVIKGIFNPDLLEENGSIAVNLIGWKDEDRSVDEYLYSSEEFTVSFLQTDVVASFVINGSTTDMTVQPGEILNSTIVLRNAGDTPIKNVTARVIFDAPSYERKSMLDWAELEDPTDADVVGEQLSVGKRRGVMTWNKNHIKDLLQVDPDEEIIADFSLPIKNAEDVDLEVYTGSEIEAVLEIRYELDGENKILSTQPMLLSVVSDTDFEIRDEVVFGDEKEDHTIKWIITNTFHELKDIKLEADIYGDITWNEELLDVPAGEFNYDEETKKVTWTIDSMPTAIDVFALQFGFTLNSYNPSQTNLMSKVNFVATDTITNDEILQVGKEIVLNSEEE
jgi:uncharacterized repeat protein (TIGR01451 family)